MKLYRSPYEAYPFLSDADGDLRCDYEILTDRMASETGLLAALCPERRDELLAIDELIYHANASLRTFLSLKPEEIDWLRARTEALEAETAGLCDRFVLPAGSPRACVAHVLRTDGKRLVRLLYRFAQRGGKVEDALFDFANLLSGYFFLLALALNHADGVPERPFESRNYLKAK